MHLADLCAKKIQVFGVQQRIGFVLWFLFIDQRMAGLRHRDCHALG